MSGRDFQNSADQKGATKDVQMQRDLNIGLEKSITYGGSAFLGEGLKFHICIQWHAYFGGEGVCEMPCGCSDAQCSDDVKFLSDAATQRMGRKSCWAEVPGACSLGWVSCGAHHSKTNLQCLCHHQN